MSRDQGVEVAVQVPLVVVADQDQEVDTAVVLVQVHRKVIADVVGGHLHMSVIGGEVAAGVGVEDRAVTGIVAAVYAGRPLDHVHDQGKSVGGVERGSEYTGGACPNPCQLNETLGGGGLLKAKLRLFLRTDYRFCYMYTTRGMCKTRRRTGVEGLTKPIGKLHDTRAAAYASADK